MLAVGFTLPAYTASAQVSTDSNVIVQSSILQLPGHLKPSEIFYEVVNGQAILEGDIDLGPVSELQSRYGGEEIARANRVENGLWPEGKVYYDPNIPEEVRSVALSAMQEISDASLGGIEFMITDGKQSYVKFSLTDEPGLGGSSPLGMQAIRNNIIWGCPRYLVQIPFNPLS